MIFRQSGAGVGAQALSFKVWWCVPCWSGGPGTLPFRGWTTSCNGFYHFTWDPQLQGEWHGMVFRLLCQQVPWYERTSLPAFFCASTLPTPTFRIHKAMLSMILGQMNQCDQRADLSKDSSRSRMHWTKNTSTTSLPADCHLAVTGGHLDTMRSEFHGLPVAVVGPSMSRLIWVIPAAAQSLGMPPDALIADWKRSL